MTLAGNFSNVDTLTIDNTVVLSGASIHGGTIDDTGTLLVSASSEIENATGQSAAATWTVHGRHADAVKGHARRRDARRQLQQCRHADD